MNHSEVPLQVDFLTGELVDTRTSRQKGQESRALKQAAKEASLPPPLFTGQETIQFGVTTARPTQPFAPSSELLFHVEVDLRTDQEKEAEAQRLAESLTQPMFAQELQDEAIDVDEDRIIYEYAQVLQLPFVVV